MDQSIIRITKELSDVQRGSDLAIAVACRDSDVRNLKALIIGPHGTPYEFGFFEFSVQFSKDYPSNAPSVNCITTNGGLCRFNPNIYANGKICLSILGYGPPLPRTLAFHTVADFSGRTWRGESGEEWSSAQGLESILLSIQSLLSPNPYENEPGFESAKGESDKQLQAAYVQKRLEGYMGLDPDGAAPDGSRPDCSQSTKDDEFSDFDNINQDCQSGKEALFQPFKDLIKRRFLWYYQSYLDAIEKGKSEVRVKQQFTRMPFEAPNSNTMDGRFNYPDLERRLRNIKAAIDAETQQWALEGFGAMARESTVSVNLMHQFNQVSAFLKGGDMPHVVALEGDNPFVWIVTYFGRPMTNLDGGLFRIRIAFSPRFPEEQPRIKLETKIFHHLVAKDGTTCYTPNPLKVEDVRSHIEAVMAVLEDDPSYDPRKIVNPEATRMCWGGDKKLYNRRLRRSVQQSME